MTTYYIELFEFSNDADISRISTNTLKEVINDFTNELNKRCTEQNLNKHLVMQAEGADGAKEAAVGQRSVGTVAEAGVDKWCDSCGKVTRWVNDECVNYTKKKAEALTRSNRD